MSENLVSKSNRGISTLRSKEMSIYEFKKQADEGGESMFNANKRIELEVPKHKSVRYTTLEFGETFKELRSLELYKSLYTTEVDKNYVRIDQQLINFRERFKMAKERMGRPEYERNEKVKALPQIPKLSTVEGLEKNLTELYDFHCKITSSVQADSGRRKAQRVHPTDACQGDKGLQQDDSNGNLSPKPR